MKMPNLNDTEFPNLNTNNVYSQYRNDFDYTRWSANTKLSLFSVPWAMDGENMVKWNSDKERDAWFDSHAEERYVTDTIINIVPNEAISLPIPYSSAVCANYLMAEIPVTPGTGAFANTSNNRVKRIFYFITDLQQTNGTVTKMALQTDFFITYINRFDLQTIMLERGHAPETMENVDEYLADPVNHTKGLLTEDVTGRDNDVVRSSSFHPFGTGEPWVLFAVNCTFEQLTQTGSVKTQDWTEPVYSDNPVRFGKQYDVGNYQWGDDYSEIEVQSSSTHSISGRTPNGFTIFGAPTRDMGALADVITHTMPALTKLVQATFVVSNDMFTTGANVELGGVTVWNVIPNDVNLIGDLHFTREQFDYPEEYSDLTKLYTSPYASAEISDNNGHTVEVKIENTGNVKMWRKVSLAYPYLNVTAFFSGINGVGTTEYEWVNLFENHERHWLANTPFEQFAMGYNIPTFALYTNGATDWLAENWQSSISNARRNALNAYHNAMRGTNTSARNTNDSNDISVANTEGSADTANKNAAESASTAYANTDRSAALKQRTTSRNNDGTNTQVYNSQIATTTVTRDNNLLGVALQRWDADLQNKETEIDMTNAQLSSATSAASGLANAVMSGNIIGGAIGAGSTAISTALQINAKYEKVQVANSNSMSRLNEINGNNTNVMNANLDAQTANNQKMIQVNADNANDAATVTRTNQSASNSATLDNTTRSSNTSISIARNNRSLSNNNTENSRRDVSEFAAKTALEQTQMTALANVNNSRRSKPVKVGSLSGDYRNDEFAMRGIQIRVKTMPEDSIRRVGDEFKRYGYTYEGYWNIDTLTLMKHFTYWKGELYAQSTVAPQEARENIQEMFLNGVTIWNNPEEIGKVDIRKNMVK